MIMTITLILLSLVAFNFFLLIFSCNKTIKKESIEQPQAIRQTATAIPTKQLVSHQLAPTGS